MVYSFSFNMRYMWNNFLLEWKIFMVMVMKFGCDITRNTNCHLLFPYSTECWNTVPLVRLSRTLPWHLLENKADASLTTRWQQYLSCWWGQKIFDQLISLNASWHLEMVEYLFRKCQGYAIFVWPHLKAQFYDLPPSFSFSVYIIKLSFLRMPSLL